MSRRAAAAVAPAVEPVDVLGDLVRRAEAALGPIEERRRRRIEETNEPSELELLQQAHKAKLRERERAGTDPAYDFLRAALDRAEQAKFSGPGPELLARRQKLQAASAELEARLETATSREREALEEGLVLLEDGIPPQAAAEGGWQWPTSDLLHGVLAAHFGPRWWESWTTRHSLEALDKDVAAAEERREQAISDAIRDLEGALETAARGW